MKRILLLALAMLMMFAFVGCGNSQNAYTPLHNGSSDSARDNEVGVTGDKVPEKSRSVVASKETSDENGNTIASQKPDTASKPVVKENSSSNENSNIQIKMTFNEGEVIVNMYDNPASRDFLTMLPLTLTFKDYNGTEKISYLPRNLSRKEAPEGLDPSVGDLALYAPWGNLALYYNDFSYYKGLIPLGHIDSGIETLANMHGDFTVTIEVSISESQYDNESFKTE